jgi:hypothetical protein
MLVDGRLELVHVDVAFNGPPVAWAVMPTAPVESNAGEDPLLSIVEMATVTTTRPPANVASVAIPASIDRDVRATLFPGRARVVADWYSGTLVILQAAMVDAMGFAGSALHARYLLVIVEQGREVKRLRLDALEFDAYRQARFRRYQQTAAYAAAMRELADYGWTADDAVANVYGDRLEEYISLEPMEGP